MFGAVLFAAVAAITPPQMKVIDQTAKEYRLTTEEKALLIAIRKVENGRPGLEWGVAQDFPNHPARRFKDGVKSFAVQCKWAAGTIKRRYRGDLVAFSKRYCPSNHANWRRMVKEMMMGE